MARILVAMSGGVDSSVAAYLLQQQGHSCIGVTMRLYDNEMANIPQERGCCTLEDVEDARAVAFRLGIPYYVFNFKDAFEQKVIRKFVDTYQSGGTPNPCIDCNRWLKFDLLLHRARELGCDFVATGHYARIGQAGGRWTLARALDPEKDQSYVLYGMTQDQLAHTLLPLGGMTKAETRAVAGAQGFVNARKRDSQDICFVPDGDYAAFLQRYTGRPLQEGDILDRAGRCLGRHRGAVCYTIGQRKGLGVAAAYPLYVCGKDMEHNTVTVGPENQLYTTRLTAKDWNRIAPELPDRAQAVVRYHGRPADAAVRSLPDGRVQLAFDTPQRAVTPGQAVVLYREDQVLGGGTIVPEAL